MNLGRTHDPQAITEPLCLCGSEPAIFGCLAGLLMWLIWLIYSVDGSKTHYMGTKALFISGN